MLFRSGRVLVYTSWIRTDTQEKLLNLLTENGYRVGILTVAVPPNKREEWVENQVKDGIQVLITNPSLVETGLDLNDFTTIYYYNISYNLFTLRQSSRRSWRINQKAPRVEVYFSYYEGTMQNRAVRLMASKLAVAGIIEGNFTDEGLAAMSDCADMTTALARELTQGIKDEVEDLGAIFKKMAILKPVETQAVPEITDEDTMTGDIGAAVEDTADVNDGFDDNTVIHVDMPVYQGYSNITDDTSEMTIYSTNAPVPTIALLTFVNSTRPERAVWDRAEKEMNSLLFDSVAELMAA